MWKNKLTQWLRYTQAIIKSKNKFLPMAARLEKVEKFCFKEVGKTNKFREIANSPDLLQFFLGPYLTAVSYHQSIILSSLSKNGLNGFVLLRPQLESTLIFLYFLDSSDEEELLNRVEEYYDWVVVKMYENAQKSNEFEFVPHLSTHNGFMKKIETNYSSLKDRYIGKDAEFNRLKRSSFLKNKRGIAKQNDIEGLFLHIQSEASASIHVADVSDRVTYTLSPTDITYSFNKYSDDSFWVLMLSNLILISLIKSMAKYFDVYPMVKEKLKTVANKT